jgi:hypothetical protein
MKSKAACYFTFNRLFFTALILFFAISTSFIPFNIARADELPSSNNFWGHITTTDGQPAPIGVQVTAWTSGDGSNWIQRDSYITLIAGQYGADPVEVAWGVYLGVDGFSGNTIKFTIDGAPAQVSRFGTMVEPTVQGDPAYWEWEDYNPASATIPFRSADVYAADLVYEPAPQDSTPPERTTDLSRVSETSNSVILTWTAPGDDGNTGNASRYKVAYRTDGEVTDGNWDSSTIVDEIWIANAVGETEVRTVTGLNPNTIYYFALKACDDANNWSLVSNNASTATLVPDITAPGAVTDLAAGNPTNSTVRLTWTAPGDDGNEGTARLYQIRYRIDSAVTDENWGEATPVSDPPAPKVAGSAETHIVTGLNSGTLYYFALKTSDEMNILSPLSNSDVHATTTAANDQVAPAAITDLATHDPTSSTIRLSWTATGDDGNEGTVTYYDIRYLAGQAVTDENWEDALRASGEPEPPKVAGLPESCYVQGLQANTVYYFAIKAVDDGGNQSPISNNADATTKKASSGGGGGGGGGGSSKSTTTTTTTPTSTTTTTTTTTAPVTTTTTTKPVTTTTTTTTTTTPTAPVSTTTTAPAGKPAGTNGTAAFQATNLYISKSNVAPGEAVQITVDMTNTGNASGNCEVALVINKLTESTKSLVLAAGETRTVNFSVTKSDSGTYKVSISGIEGTFSVAGAVRWVLIAEIIGGVVVLGLIIFVVRRIVMVNAM